MYTKSKDLIALVFLSLLFTVSCNHDNSEQGDRQSGSLRFTDITTAAGFDYTHGYTTDQFSQPRKIAGGVAAGDYNDDGWVDLYVVRGDIGPNLLFRNQGDGSFEEIGQLANVALTETRGSGPVFADLDGDGWLDLVVGGIDGTGVYLFHNRGDETFEDTTLTSGIDVKNDTFSIACGDYDRDGYIDIFFSHWVFIAGGAITESAPTKHLWRNNGDRTFTDVSDVSGVSVSYLGTRDHSFSPTFADITNDGWPDLLVASDFETTKVFHNNRDGTFTDVTDPEIITDENGMGSALGDFDNDGDLDWFVSSIFTPECEQEFLCRTGNRLYENKGDGTFDEVSERAGVRHGFWGWGSCFADFNNDGHPDIFHVNGFEEPLFRGTDREVFIDDPSRLFISNADGTFSEVAMESGIIDNGQGRGVVCFDYDHDGDIDIFVANNQQSPRFFRNELRDGDIGGTDANYVNIKLQGLPPNTEALGARIMVTSGGQTQMQELYGGSNFVSQNPAEAHFGLGDALVVEQIQVFWPDGAVTSFENEPVNQFLKIAHPGLAQ